MNDTVFLKLLQLNHDFYDHVGESFSQTRTHPWKGWERLLPLFTNDRLSLLDVGCGNGRFGEFLHTSIKDIHYIGLDTSETLLEEARDKKLDVKHCDVIQGAEQITGMFDAVCAFGITHHIPSHDFRLRWFSAVSSLVAPQGYFICTFWNFLDSESQKAVRAIHTPSADIQEHEIEEGDFFLGWDLQSDVWRYCHAYSEDEISEIEHLLMKKGFSLVDEYFADGKNNQMNRYVVFQNRLSSPRKWGS